MDCYVQLTVRGGSRPAGRRHFLPSAVEIAAVTSAAVPSDGMVKMDALVHTRNVQMMASRQRSERTRS